MMFIILSILILLITIKKGLSYREKALSLKLEADKRHTDTLSLLNNSKYQMTQSIEVQIKSLSSYYDVLGEVMLSLSSELHSCDDSDYNEILSEIESNTRSILKVEKSIEELEKWYFLNHGKHYLQDTEAVYYQDFTKKFSKN